MGLRRGRALAIAAPMAAAASIGALVLILPFGPGLAIVAPPAGKQVGRLGRAVARGDVAHPAHEMRVGRTRNETRPW